MSRAEVLLAMPHRDRWRFVTARIRDGRHEQDVALVERLLDLMAEPAVHPASWPDRLLADHPQIRLRQYCRALRRAQTERHRFTLVHQVLGTRNGPIPLTPGGAERLVEMLAAWSPDGIFRPGDTSLPDGHHPKEHAEPHAVWLPDEGTAP